jgi:rhomboid protease GluP
MVFAITGYVNKRFNKVWFAAVLAFLIYSYYIAVNDTIDNASLIGGWAAGVIVGFLFYYFHFRRNIARAGGTRISIEIMLITALLIFLYIRGGKDDSLRFERAIMKLNQIELKAMTQMQQLQNAESDQKAAEILKEEALPLWRNFQNQINKTDRYKLDDKFQEKRKLLHEYAELRIRQTDLIYKSISEETDKYNTEIDTVSDKIETLIDQIGM